MLPSASEPQRAQLNKTWTETGVVFLLLLCAWFYPAWRTVRNATGQDSEPRLSNVRLHHSRLIRLDKLFLLHLINFPGHFFCHWRAGWGFVEVLMGWLFSQPSNSACVCVCVWSQEFLTVSWENSRSRYTGNYFLWWSWELMVELQQILLLPCIETGQDMEIH